MRYLMTTIKYLSKVWNCFVFVLASAVWVCASVEHYCGSLVVQISE